MNILKSQARQLPVSLLLSTVSLLCAYPVCAQPAPESLNWGPPSGGLQVGWEPINSTIYSGEPLVLFVRIRTPPGAAPLAIQVPRALFFYDVQVSLGSDHTPVRLTAKGMEETDPLRTLGVGGGVLGQRTIIRHEIRLSDWWDLSEPGSYTVSIAHLQGDSKGERPVIVHAPEFHFEVVP